MYISKQEILIWVLLLLQLSSLFAFNGLIVAVIILLAYSFLHIKVIAKIPRASTTLVLSIVIIGLVNSVYNKFMYGQSISDGLIGIYFLGMFFSYFVFIRYFENDKSRIDKLNERVMIISAVVSVLAILQTLLYPYINLFDFSIRNGRMRIPGTAMSFFAEIIGIAYLLMGRANTRMKVSLAILVFALFYVSQSRSGIILLFLAAVFTIAKKMINAKSKKAVVLLLGFVIGIVIFILLLSRTQIWQNIFSFVDEINSGTGSGATRVNEMLYYWKQMSGKELFGLGLLRGGSALANWIFREDLHYYIEDLGLLGFIFQTGLLGLLWVVYAVVKIIAKISGLTKGKTQISNTISMILVMLLIVTLVGVTNANYIVARSTIFFFCMLLAEADVLLADISHEANNTRCEI